MAKIKVTAADGSKLPRISKEYLRRNLIHAASIGVIAGIRSARFRLTGHKRPPLWLIEILEGIEERACRVAPEMAAHRDERSPYRNYKPNKKGRVSPTKS